MKSELILNQALVLFNEPVDRQALTQYLLNNTVGNVSPESYCFGYGDALLDLCARLGIDVSAFPRSRGEEMTIVDDGPGPTRAEVEKLQAAYIAGQEEKLLDGKW